MTTTSLVDLIHQQAGRGVIISTGGGTEIFQMLLHRGGGSATLISGIIPYDEGETIELMGGKPDRFASEESARILAMVAFQRAVKRRKGDEPVFGVATSSVLQRTPKERPGRLHSIFGALQTSTKTVSLTLNIPDGTDLYRRSPFATWVAPTPLGIRLNEEYVNTQILLNLIAEGCHLKDRVKLKFDADTLVERHASTFFTGTTPVEDLLMGTRSRLAFDCHDDGTILINPDAVPGSLIFPGSFNPAHMGHFEIADTATVQYAKNRLITEAVISIRLPITHTEFEISITNTEKPMLDLLSLERRLRGFTGRGQKYRVWVTNAARFFEKASVFPGATFVMGYDTAVRMHDPRYGNLGPVMQAFIDNNNRFMVFGRDMGEGICYDMENFHAVFQARAVIVRDHLRYREFSSSQIRKASQTGSESGDGESEIQEGPDRIQSGQTGSDALPKDSH